MFIIVILVIHLVTKYANFPYPPPTQILIIYRIAFPLIF